MKNITYKVKAILILLAAVLLPSQSLDLTAGHTMARQHATALPDEIDFGADIDIHSIKV